MFEQYEVMWRFSDAEIQARKRLVKATTRKEYLDILKQLKIAALYLQDLRHEATKEFGRRFGKEEDV